MTEDVDAGVPEQVGSFGPYKLKAIIPPTVGETVPPLSMALSLIAPPRGTGADAAVASDVVARVTVVKLNAVPMPKVPSSARPESSSRVGSWAHTAGTGKSTLAAQFCDAACRRGERAMYFAFEESEAEIARDMASVGLDLMRWVDAGLPFRSDALPWWSTAPTSHV